MPYVVVQEDGGFEPLADWTPVRSFPGGIVDPDEDARWKDLSREAVERALELDVRRALNVFLILDEEELLRRDQTELSRLLDRVRDFSWGATPYLVSNPIKLSTFLEQHKADLAAWMSEAIDRRVADFLQVPDVLRSDVTSLWSDLRSAAARARARRHNLRPFHTGSWRCAVPKQGNGALVDLLEPMATNDPTQLGDSNLLIVVTSRDAGNQVETVRSHLKHWHGRTCQVATIGWRRRPTHELNAYCRDHGLGPILAFDGVMELWFWLLRANRAARLEAGRPPFLHNLDADREPILNRRPLPPRPFVLLTASFGLDEIDQWQLAAEDVGAMIVRLPFDLDFHVALALTPTSLLRALEAYPATDVWVHMGHGSGSSGLWIPENGHVAPQRWIECFAGRELQLALFLTCDSDKIAKAFAAAGAELAVGFKGKVESDKTRELAIDLIKALALGGSQGEAIVTALGTGAPHFDAAQNLTATVHAYRPRRR